MCRIDLHILSTHSVLLDILTVINTDHTPYVLILHFVHIYIYTTHNNMQRDSRLYMSRICNVMDAHWMLSTGSRYIVVFVQCARVVQLNCVKVQCMAYCKVGVFCRVYWF